VFSKEHVIEIAQFAQRHYLPIISDEIYAEMIFPGHTFHSIASVGVAVPSLICGGIGKQYLIPGWRLGWILIHDPIGAFKDEVRDGLSRLSMKILGPCTVIQAALPAIFDKVPHSFHEKNIEVFRRNAELIYKGLSQVPGLNPIMPAGAMYIMVGIDIGHFPLFKDDIDFTKHLVIEQSVFCLPGTALDSPNFFRIVLVMPPTKISEAIERISLFCSQHYQ
jgi:tyrosine aminotransferase